MKITSTEEYGIRCLLRVGKQTSGDPISAQAVAQFEGLSVAYAQKLLRILNQAELIEARRGAAGGYVLSRPAEEISLGDAIRALGGMIELDHLCDTHAGNNDVCCHANNCALRPVWSCLSEFIVLTFDSIPLSLMLHREQEVATILQQLVPSTSVVQSVISKTLPA